MADLLMVGAGPQALALSCLLLQKRPPLHRRLRIVDPSGQWLTRWQRQMERYEIPWLPLKEAAPLLHFPSPRALKNRILRGSFPPDCFRQMPSPSGKRHSYLVNVERYLKTLR